MKEKISRFPLDPARMPFFYGWIVLGAGTLGMVMSAPGQTVGVSVFTDYLIDALHIERSGLSLAYLLGTVGSALALARAGALYDRWGGRMLATIASVALAVVLVLLSFSGDFAAALRVRWAVFLMITIGFFLLRFSGQGMLTLASRNMVMEWFSRRRGLANAVMGISLSFGFSSAPRFFEALIHASGWQGAWRILAAVLAGFAVFSFLFYRNRPEDHGLLPDGPLKDSGRKTHPESHAGRDFTLIEARRTRAFWAFAATLVLAGLLMTAYTFHIVSIFADAGMDRSRAVSVFLPAAVVAVIVEFTGSWMSDFIRLKWLALLQLAGVVILSISLVFLRPGLFVALAILGQGIMQGMFGIIANVTWPRFFGRKHLGAISGFASSIGVVGTAVGPFLFSTLRDVTGGYGPAGLIVALLAVGTAVLIAGAERPE